MNSDDFISMIKEDDNALSETGFPSYDPIGWIYARKKFPEGNENPKFVTHYQVDDRKLTWYKIAFYKDAYIFYGALVLLSIVFSLVFYY